MGKLPPNMLLSFATFDREVNGERIRDKVASTKRKGMWMGGNVPLGYVAQDRKPVINSNGGGDRPPHLPDLSVKRFGAAAEEPTDG